MLKLRKEQMSALEKASQEDFHRRLLRFLRQEMPELKDEFSDADLLERIAESERRASTYGIVSEAGISQFVCLTFVGGPAFDEIPEVNSYLREPEGEPEQKLDELVDFLAALEEEGLE
jgi:hypothetical protein